MDDGGWGSLEAGRSTWGSDNPLGMGVRLSNILISKGFKILFKCGILVLNPL